MSIPWAFERSPFNCPRDGKALTMQLGQNAEHGHLEQHHFCLHCDYVHVASQQPRARVPMTAEQILARRLAHLDREVAHGARP